MAKVKTATLWLVRESKKQGGFYLIYGGSKPRKPKGGWQYLACDKSFCFTEWELLCPEDIHLRPGGGPIPIVVQRGHRK